MIIKEIDVKSVMTKSNLPVSDFSVNPYVGCSHACKYCYASFMKQFYDAGIQTTCFISPIFPGITDPIEIIEMAKNRCNLVWLENLNLRGDYGARIKDWIHENHPELDGLYHDIYNKKSREYWTALDEKMREYTAKEGMPYLRDDDNNRSPFGELPVVVNYFYHEEVKKSAKKDK